MESIILGILLRYAATAAGSAAVAIGTYFVNKYGVSWDTVAEVGGGLATAGTALTMALMKNSSTAKVLSRLPIIDVLHAVANSTRAKVNKIDVADPALADAVPSPKVVSEGQSPALI